ncbi:hypothetical protein [Carboxylicivirga sp. N1Y90]|uniref:hypothetical protein n=1 Tax=Carboxylicivirga fragile TaxID=3417571 RepID=UPI003D32AC9E|nr:hypothetical protein [Marinilabiliaceae bacterium N1Y90]
MNKNLHIDLLEYLLKNNGNLSYVNVRDFFFDKGLLKKVHIDKDCKVTKKQMFHFVKDLEEIGLFKSNNNDFKYSESVDNIQLFEDIALNLKLLPKGIDFINDHRKRKTDNLFKIITVILLLGTLTISIMNFICIQVS